MLRLIPRITLCAHGHDHCSPSGAMNYGLYLSATGVLTAMHRQDVLANNLANVETTGFKPDLVLTRQRDAARLEQASALSPALMLEMLGGGHLLEPTRPNLTQGALESTGSPLDLAIEGEGFLVVQGAGENDALLTRDGRLSRAADGTLVLAANGRAVLDVNGRSIRLAETGAVTIDGAGVIRQDGAEVAQLDLRSAPADGLAKIGQNLFRFDGDLAALPPADAAVRQGFIEGSAVDPITTLNALIGATRAITANSKLMQYHDFLSGQAIGTFGRVA